MRVLGIPIDNLAREAVLDRVAAWLAGEGFHRIATVNPEFLLLAEKNPLFCRALLSADLRVADGVGLHLPFWLAGEKLIGRYPGADLLHDILELAQARGYGVALALHEHGLSSPLQILAATKEKYPQLKVELLADASILDSQSSIILCNFGAPLQETYLESLRTKAPRFRLAMGVGGAFDFLTGAVPRAPSMMQQLGLEWLWRLYQQPKRFRRIWNAVVVFPVRVLSQK